MNRNLSVTLKFLNTRSHLVNVLFYSPVYNRNGLTGWVRAIEPRGGFGGFGYPGGTSYPNGFGSPGGFGYGAAPFQYPQLNYPQLTSAPILYPQSSYAQPYAQPHGIGGYFQPCLQPYTQPLYSPMSSQLQVYSPMINRVPYGYLPY